MTIINRRRIPLSIAAAAGLSLSGCANENSIFRINRVSSERPTVVTVDSKQRHLVTVPDGEREGQWRICAEASPDVFSALSTSAAADLGFGQSAGQTEAQAQAAIAIAESAATIERTQTINMLRESMYRTCERYLSGAINRATFVVQAGRDWRAMIAILAIEQLTRVVRPPSTVISPGGTSVSVVRQADVDAQVVGAQGDVDRANEALRIARAADPQSCDPLTDANREACTRKAQAVQAAETRVQTATQNRDYWQRRSENPPPPNRTEAQTETGANDPGGSTTQPSAATDVVARTVGEIVRRAFDTDETQLFCLQVLAPESGLRVEDRLKQRCTDYLLAVVEAEGALLLQRADLRHRGFGEAMEVRSAIDQLLDHLRRLTPAQYPAEAEAIRQTIPSFCTRASTLEECIRSVEEGSLDTINADRVRQAVEARRQQGGQW